MPNATDCRRLALLFILLCMAFGAVAQQTVTLTLDQPQTAGISGFRAFWDLPVVTGRGRRGGDGRVDL